MVHVAEVDRLRSERTLDQAIEAHEDNPTRLNAIVLIAVALDYHRDEMLGADGFHANVDDALATLMEGER